MEKCTRESRCEIHYTSVHVMTVGATHLVVYDGGTFIQQHNKDMHDHIYCKRSMGLSKEQ